jgi:hypothetical protein
MQKGNFYKIQEGKFREEQYETEPHCDYEAPQGFPSCCVYHETIKNQLDSWFTKFPNCCQDHKHISTQRWFKKSNYNHVPMKIVEQLSYTEAFVFQAIDKENWFEEITNFIEYSIKSFGTPSIGGKRYYMYLDHWIKNSKKITKEFPKEKKRILIKHLDKFTNPPKKPKSDINILNNLFQRWLKAFPDLEYFKELRKRHLNKFPFQVILYDPQFNRFNGETKFKTRSKAELITILLDATKNILRQTERKGANYSITYIVSHRIQLLSESHRIKQYQLLNTFSKGEIRYFKIIKKWLRNEKKYFKELEQILKSEQDVKKLASIDTIDEQTLRLSALPEDILELKSLAELLPSLDKLKVNDGALELISIEPKANELLKVEVQNLIDNYESVKSSVHQSYVSRDNISRANFNQIIQHIITIGINLEKQNELHEHFGEEQFRDYLLPYLNSIFKETTTTGETFNKIGKSDILIQNNQGENVFIAECKIWKGEAEFSDAINQLFDRYINWRNEKAALIFFNKKNKGFNDVITKGREAIKKHEYFESFLTHRNDSSSSYVFLNPDDKSQKIYLELIFLNCYNE